MSQPLFCYKVKGKMIKAVELERKVESAKLYWLKKDLHCFGFDTFIKLIGGTEK